MVMIPGFENVNGDEIPARNGLQYESSRDSAAKVHADGIKHSSDKMDAISDDETAPSALDGNDPDLGEKELASATTFNGVKMTNTKPFEPEGPQPLLRETEEGKPYPVEALGSLRGVVEAVQASTGAPVAIAAQSALAVVSLAVQGFADVETLAGAAPTSLYAFTIARSGERKSSCDKQFMKAIHNHERDAEAQRREEMAGWQNSAAIWDQSHSSIMSELKKRGASDTAALADLDALGARPEPPPSQTRTATEPTFEGLTRLFQEGQPSLGLFSDEGVQFLGGHGMNSDNKQKTLAGLNGLWDGAPVRRTRGGDGSTTLFGNRLALHLMVQPSVARGILSDDLAGGIGFLPRCLICEPVSTIGTRLSSNMQNHPVPINEFSEQLEAILVRPMPMRNEGTRELDPRLLQLSLEARELLVQFSDRVELAQRTGKVFAGITGCASKAQEQAARIAGVLTLWADLDALEVSAATMKDAITLSKYYLSEALRLAGAAVVSPDIEQAEKLRCWLIERYKGDVILLRQVVRLGPNSLRVGDVARRAIGKLTQSGWLVKMEEGSVIDGKSRKEAYWIVRGEFDGAGQS